jgi:hypothetical protein
VTDAGAALLRVAQATLVTDRLPGPIAVRTASVLTRLAVERAVRDRLRRDLPGAEAGSFRAQLLCLRSLDAHLGAEAAQLHGELSRACHHLPYELGPTRDEAAALVERGERVVTRAAGPSPTPARAARAGDALPPPPSAGEQVALPLDDR